VTRRLQPLLVLIAAWLCLTGSPALAESYVPVSGAGSTWSQNALDQWRRNVNQYGMQINYQGTGSSDGRNQYRNGTVDFGVSEIPYGLKDGGVVDTPPSRGYAYMPIVAGGTSFMYNLKIGGHRVTNLRLSGENITKIFTGVITSWADPALKKDNPGLALPARKIVPVVRSDGSGTTAQFTLWMSKQYSSLWDTYCAANGMATPCGLTSNYPVKGGSGFVALSGSLGVAGYVSQDQSEGALTYVEYSYAVNTGFPVIKVLNKAGYYNEPTAQNVAVALLKARINDDQSSSQYLTQILDGVYNNADARTYPLSSYSYMIIPTKVEGSFSKDKGRTLGAFAYYFLCEGQQQAPLLGYSPLPINLVQAGLAQVKRIPGVDQQTVDIKKCNNPTFSSDGTNTLAKTAPQPAPCDHEGTTQCGTGTGGAKSSTPRTAGGSTTGAGIADGSGSTAGGAASTGTAGTGAGTTGALMGSSSTGSTGLTSGATTGVGTAGGPAPALGGSVEQASTDVVAVPVSVGATLGSASAGGLVVFVVLLVLGLSLGPPLVGRRLDRRQS
jgi:phosphate ABC transporter phosphate-binding protein